MLAFPRITKLGNDKNDSSRVQQNFPPYCTKDMLTGKWATLNANWKKFNAIFKHLKRLSRSGENEVDLMTRVRQSYR